MLSLPEPRKQVRLGEKRRGCAGKGMMNGCVRVFDGMFAESGPYGAPTDVSAQIGSTAWIDQPCLVATRVYGGWGVCGCAEVPRERPAEAVHEVVEGRPGNLNLEERASREPAVRVYACAPSGDGVCELCLVLSAVCSEFADFELGVTAIRRGNEYLFLAKFVDDEVMAAWDVEPFRTRHLLSPLPVFGITVMRRIAGRKVVSACENAERVAL